jgi:hypothetical protein
MHILVCVHLQRYLERTFLCLYDYSWWVGLDWTFVHMLDVGLYTRTPAYCGPFLVYRYLLSGKGLDHDHSKLFIYTLFSVAQKS